MNVIHHSNLNNFLIENEKVIRGQYFEHYHLDNICCDIYNNSAKFKDAFNVLDKNNNIRVLLANHNQCYIYGDCWEHEALIIIADRIKNYKLNTISVYGNRILIFEIIKYLNVDYHEKNNRIIFKNNSLYESKDKNEFLQIELGSFKDIVEIQNMHFDYYKEDFPYLDKTVEQINQIANEYIEEKRLFIWRNDSGKITSKIEIINFEPNKIMFGGFFSKKEYRGNGYATNLLKNLTTYFSLEKDCECGLLTENSNLIARNTFVKSGYIQVYQLTYGEIANTTSTNK